MASGIRGKGKTRNRRGPMEAGQHWSLIHRSGTDHPWVADKNGIAAGGDRDPEQGPHAGVGVEFALFRPKATDGFEDIGGPGRRSVFARESVELADKNLLGSARYRSAEGILRGGIRR